MHFSFFLTTRSMSPDEDKVVLDTTIEYARSAEELGFDAVFTPDHHFTGYAPWASDPFMFASYLAAILKRVYLGFSVTTVPLHHPVRIAERLNLLQFETSAYKGAVVQRIAPASYTKPYPRLMPVAGRESSIALAAKNGWPAFINAFTPPVIDNTEPLKHFTNNFVKYRDALIQAGQPAEVIAQCLSWTTRTYQIIHVANSDGQAREELHTIIHGYKAAIEREYVYNKRAEQISGVDLHAPPDPFGEGWIKTWCLYGSPDTVAAELQPYVDLGAGNVLGSFTHGPLTPERRRLTESAMQLFAREVMPRFRDKGKRVVGSSESAKEARQ